MLKGSNVQSIFLAELPPVRLSVRSDGSGTIQFGTASSKYAGWANSGMDWFGPRSGVLAFYDVPDVEAVFRTMAEATDVEH